MVKRWFAHGKWPKWMVQLHYYTIGSFILLLISGIALFWPPVHATLIRYLPIIYYVHIVFGIIFGLTLLIPIVTRLPLGKLIRRLDWLLPLVFGSGIVLTGMLVWQVSWFPTTWRSVAFQWHGWMSYVLATWLLVHAVYKALSYRPADDGMNARVDPSRRQFLQWVGSGIAGTAVLVILDPVAILKTVLQPRNSIASGGGTTSDFAAYYTVTNGYPSADLSTYHLTIDGLVSQPVTLSWAEFTALEAAQEEVDFHCVTGWSVPNVKWQGVHMQALLNLAKPSSATRYVNFYSFDGAYTESLPLAEALDPTVLLAYRLNGQPLSTQQGFPVRLVVPKMYGYKSIKWVNRVEFSDKPLVGYWEARGYASEAYIGHGI